jgi:hypothetical protein
MVWLNIRWDDDYAATQSSAQKQNSVQKKRSGVAKK